MMMTIVDLFKLCKRFSATIVKMCYTARASITAWLVNVMTCATLLYVAGQNAQYQALAYFFLFVGTMQIYDYIFHTYPSDSDINYYATKAAMITNHLIPLVLAGVIVFVMKKPLTRSSRFMVMLYAIVALLYTWQAWNNVQYTKKVNEYVVWNWNSQEYAEAFTTLFLFTMFVLFKGNFSHKIGSIGAVISIVSFFIAYSLFQKHKSTGRFWCYFAVYVPLIYIPFALGAPKA